MAELTIPPPADPEQPRTDADAARRDHKQGARVMDSLYRPACG